VRERERERERNKREVDQIREAVTSTNCENNEKNSADFICGSSPKYLRRVRKEFWEV
jgi:hypothetical protein